jgi:hypothetical protein
MNISSITSSHSVNPAESKAVLFSVDSDRLPSMITEGAAALQRASLEAQKSRVWTALTNLSSSSIPFMIHLMEETYAIGNSLLQSASEEVKIYADWLSKKMTKYMDTIKKTSEKLQESGFWATLQKIGSYVLSSFNFFLGTTLYTSGSTELGSALIASSVLSVANQAMVDLRGYDAIAERLAMDRKNAENLIFWSPIGLQILSAALGTIGGTSLLQDSTFLSGQLDLKNCFEVYKGVVTAGKSITDAGLSFTKAGLSDLQNILQSESLLQDFLTNWIQSFLKLLEQVCEQTKNIIQLNSQLRM